MVEEKKGRRVKRLAEEEIFSSFKIYAHISPTTPGTPGQVAAAEVSDEIHAPGSVPSLIPHLTYTTGNDFLG